MNINPKNCKVLFYSEDGIKFKCYIDGHELALTKGVTIEAGFKKEVTVTPKLIAIDGFDTFKKISHKSV